ncbi:TetR/AcrR family transcriptional regulator [Cryobacterium sp. 10C2]|nr:TetR/AcrR family transcriptional regulator [Cryobacterium sp. 10C2]MDY7528906.1 TetR/AcrR family transcriptional regulator [Cryobacterium sp. 10C2]
MPERTINGSHSGSGRTPSASLEPALLAAAERVLAEVGLDGLTVRAVAAEANVAPMGVYNRFTNKAGLVEALMARAFDDLAAAISADDQDPIARLRSSSVGYRAFALAHPERYRMIFGGFVPSKSPVGLRVHGRSAFGVFVDGIGYAIRQGAIGDRDASTAAQQMWSAMHGAIALELASMGFVEDYEALYTGLMEIVLAGMRGEPQARPIGNTSR